MCGRYTFFTPVEIVQKRFNAVVDTPEIYKQTYNAAPTQLLPIIRTPTPNGKQTIIEFYSWGLVPSWSKDASVASSLINARSETVMVKPSFRQSFVSRRCIVLANGFYEWKKEGKSKQPYYVHKTDDTLYAMAGLWDHWRHPTTGSILRSFTILTTQANEKLASIHHRMPVFLHKKDENLWLDSHSTIDQLQSLFQPYPNEEISVFPVSVSVNSSRVDSPELINVYNIHSTNNSDTSSKNFSQTTLFDDEN